MVEVLEAMQTSLDRGGETIVWSGAAMMWPAAEAPGLVLARDQVVGATSPSVPPSRTRGTGNGEGCAVADGAAPGK